jgi:uncharacterized integral membrane protein
MIIVGFVLLAAAAVVAVALIIQNPGPVTVHAFTWSWNVDMRWLFVAGLALTAIGLFGLAMMRMGSARYLRLRRDRKVLAAENERLVKRAGAVDERPAHARLPRRARAAARTPVEPRPAAQPTATAPSAAQPAATAPPAARPTAQPAPPAPAQRPATTPPMGGPGAPTAPATGSVAAPERPADPSRRPHRLRERLSATRHRHERE